MDNPRYKQLQEEYAGLTDEKERINKLVEIALEIRNIDVDRALEMADEIVERSQKAGYLLGEGRGYNMKGWCFWQQGNYDAGIEVIEQAYSIGKKIKNRPLQARALNNFGYIFRDRGDLANALNNFEKALAINEELGDEVSQSVNLASIAYLHYDLNDYENALEFALKCLPIFERANDIHRLTTLYQILGNIYFKLEQLQEALRYFEENMHRLEPDTSLHVLAISGVGKVYYKMQDFEHARQFLTQALGQGEDLGNVEVQITAHFYLGRMHMDEENYRRSLMHLEAAFRLAEEYMRRHDLMSVHEGLSNLYDRMGDVPKAFHHLKAYEQLKEEIFKQTTYNKLRNVQIRQQVELAKKEKEVAERTAQLKQQFMANMSHEIRTPMNAIVGMTNLLLSKDPRTEQLRYLKAIQQSADNLLVIINDILDLSKIEAGKIIIENTDFSLGEVVQGMRDMLMLKAEEKHLDLRIYVDAQIPRRLMGDPTRLNQILVNLAGNAIKFTEKGFVEIKATLQRQEEQKYWIQMDVIDTGIGIAADYVDKIFDSFTQAGTDTARKFGGTGLGLTISKQLATLMHGSISVKSELGKGTIFTVTIPFEKAETTTAEAEKTGVNEQAIQLLNDLHILLVEDNEFNQMVAEDTLKEVLSNVHIDIAANGKEALDLLKQRMYDVVLMDIQMPVMDGIEATKQIRSTLPEPARSVKIIAMTANVLQEDVKHYFEIGMNAYVSKPFQTEELLHKMASVVAPHKTTTEMNLPEEKTTASILPEQVTDLQFLTQFTNGNTEKIQKYIGMFLENAPKLLQTIEQTLAAKDFPALKIAAHSLKPQLSYMGVKEEVSHIFLIEQTASEAVHYERLLPLVANLKNVCNKAFEELIAVRSSQ